MNKENVLKVCDSLPEYKQCQDRLREGDSFCCLGVACEVYRLETGKGRWESDRFYVDDESIHDSLLKAVQEWLGFPNQEGPPTCGAVCATAANDDDGRTFVEIAADWRRQVEAGAWDG